MRDILVGLLTLPVPFALAGMLGLLVWRRRRLSAVLILIGSGGLLALCVPAVGAAMEGFLVSLVRPYQPDHTADAVLVPTAGVYQDPAGTWRPSAASLIRAVAGAAVHRETGLPLVVIGGAPSGEETPEALVVATALGWDADRVHLESAARNSRETAVAAAQILAKLGAERVILVTSPLHQARMAASLRRHNFSVLGHPAKARSEAPPRWQALVPSGDGFMKSRAALYEVVGLLWYWLKGYIRLADMFPNTGEAT